jgi:hypothetical protein
MTVRPKARLIAALVTVAVTSFAGACFNSSGTPAENPTPTPAPTTAPAASTGSTDPAASATTTPDPGSTSGVTQLPSLPPGDPNTEVPHDPLPTR